MSKCPSFPQHTRTHTYTHICFWRESFQECLNEEKTKSLSTSPLRCHGNDMVYSHVGYFPLELSRSRDDHTDVRKKTENAIFSMSFTKAKYCIVMGFLCFNSLIGRKKHLIAPAKLVLNYVKTYLITWVWLRWPPWLVCWRNNTLPLHFA